MKTAMKCKKKTVSHSEMLHFWNNKERGCDNLLVFYCIKKKSKTKINNNNNNNNNNNKYVHVFIITWRTKSKNSEEILKKARTKFMC